MKKPQENDLKGITSQTLVPDKNVKAFVGKIFTDSDEYIVKFPMAWGNDLIKLNENPESTIVIKEYAKNIIKRRRREINNYSLKTINGGATSIDLEKEHELGLDDNIDDITKYIKAVTNEINNLRTNMIMRGKTQNKEFTRMLAFGMKSNVVKES